MAKRTGRRVNVRRTVITLVAVYVVCHLIYGGSSIVNLKMQQHQLAQELDAAYAAQSELQAQLEYMNSGDAIETIAREKLGLVKDGEILIQRVETRSAK